MREPVAAGQSLEREFAQFGKAAALAPEFLGVFRAQCLGEVFGRSKTGAQERPLLPQDDGARAAGVFQHSGQRFIQGTGLVQHGDVEEHRVAGRCVDMVQQRLPERALVTAAHQRRAVEGVVVQPASEVGERMAVVMRARLQRHDRDQRVSRIETEQGDAGFGFAECAKRWQDKPRLGEGVGLTRALRQFGPLCGEFATDGGRIHAEYAQRRGAGGARSGAPGFKSRRVC